MAVIYTKKEQSRNISVGTGVPIHSGIAGDDYTDLTSGLYYIYTNTWTSFVPYTGAIQDVDLGEYELKAGQIELDQTPTGTAGVAVMRWNDADGTVDLGLKGGNVTLQVGQEQVLRAVNKTATNINLLEANYQAVRVTGAQGQRLKVDLAISTNDMLSAETIGLVTETINNNEEGFITTSGLVRGVNTTGSLQGETWVDGDIVYLSATTAGNITNIKPIAPNHLVVIGYVVSAHITQGSIFVKVDNGYELEELHNVSIDGSLANNDVIQYDSATLLWKNRPFSTAISSEFIFVNQKADFPTPSGGVITLQAGKTYIVTTSIDLLGDRLVAGGACNLFGTSSETSFLTSTGLGVSTALITSIYTIVLERISFKDVGTCLSIDGNTNLVALDWKAVNFINIPNVGVINKCDNFIFDTGAFLGSQGLRFTGSIGTIGLNNSLFRGLGSAGNILELDASCTITRRFRIIYSSIIAFSSTVGINVNASATISDERYILDTVNFSGGGTYLTGVTETSNKAIYSGCVGITNTAVNGQLYMQGNATATVVSATNTFYKVLGTTTASADNAKYTHTNNRLTNDASIRRKYLIHCSLSFNAGNNNVCEFGFYDSVLAGLRTPSKTKSTANGSGRAESVSFSCVVSHVQGDYLEIHCSNTSAITDITVTDMNFITTEIK